MVILMKIWFVSAESRHTLLAADHHNDSSICLRNLSSYVMIFKHLQYVSKVCFSCTTVTLLVLPVAAPQQPTFPSVGSLPAPQSFPPKQAKSILKNKPHCLK